MRNVIIAKLIKDLPELKAGALFYSLNEHHWNNEYPDEEYNNKKLHCHYWCEKPSLTIGVPTMDEYEYHNAEDLKDWCLFFDYSKGKFVHYDNVIAFTIEELETLEVL